jgi:hypothetical protein
MSVGRDTNGEMREDNMTTLPKAPATTNEGVATIKMPVRSGLARLRDPFEPNEMGKLPKQLSRDDKVRAQCRQGTNASADGTYCGGYHARSIHLDYVGHAAITKRLLEVDEDWEWEPMAVDESGLPTFDRDGGLWIRLTVLGKTKLGYGDAQGKTGPNAVKEAIGDALRNAGMRFGMALDLWHKGDLYANEVEQGKLEAEASEAPKAESAKPVKKVEDWLDIAKTKATADEVLEVWRNAKVARASTAVLAEITAHGAYLREREEAEAVDPATDPVAAGEQVSDQMKGAFGG